MKRVSCFFLLILLASSYSDAGEVQQNRCRSSLLNLLHQFESRGARRLEIVEFHHGVNTREIFGSDSLRIASVPMLSNIFGIYRRPVVARAARGTFSDTLSLGDVPNSEFTRLLRPNTHYTYVIDDAKIVFAETRPGIMRNLASKHAILRDQTRDLHLAGEFYIDERGVFHFDGASGTFQPPNEVTQRGLTFFRDHLGISNAQVHLFESKAPKPSTTPIVPGQLPTPSP